MQKSCLVLIMIAVFHSSIFLVGCTAIQDDSFDSAPTYAEQSSSEQSSFRSEVSEINSGSSETAISIESSSLIEIEDDAREDSNSSKATLDDKISSTPSGVEEISFEECLDFQNYLEENLDGDDYAYIRMCATGQNPCIWIVDSSKEKVDSIISSYTGKMSAFEIVYTNYSYNQINKAIQEIQTLPMVVNSYRKISSISCYEGFVDVLLLEPFEELKSYLNETYGAMVRITVIGVNPN